MPSAACTLGALAPTMPNAAKQAATMLMCFIGRFLCERVIAWVRNVLCSIPFIEIDRQSMPWPAPENFIRSFIYP